MQSSNSQRSSANLDQNHRTATYELKFSSDAKGVTLKVVVLTNQGSQWFSLRQFQKHHPDLSMGLGLLASVVLFILVACLLVHFLIWLD